MEENENKKEKECLFSFAKINKYFIFPFLCPLFCMICNYLIEKINNDKGLKNKECFLAIIECSTFIGGGLLYFISSLREKTDETRENAHEYIERRSSLRLIYNDSNIRPTKQIIKSFILLFIMASSVSFFDIIEVYSFDRHIFEARFYLILFIAILSHIILKIKIYNHQILSLSMALLGFILLFLPTILDISTDDISMNILTFISSIFFALFVVLIRYLTHIYFISPYLCLLFVGIVSTLITFIYFFFYSLVTYNNLSFIINSFDFSNLEIGNWIYLYLLIIIISGSILQTFSFLVIYYFSPTLYMVTDIMTPFLLWVINIVSNDEETVFNKTVNSVGYFIVLIASLIFNEIIICNFCDFNKYTKKYLEKRQNEEIVLLKQTENSQYIENDNSGNENDNDNSGNENENENENENDNNNDENENDNNNNENNNNIENHAEETD